MNVELLRKIKDKILEQPEGFQMEGWHCGTAHCIAGWAQILSGYKESSFFCEFDATEALGLPQSGPRHDIILARDRLFHDVHWPEQFKEPCLTAGQYAKQAAKRIEFFIQTNGTDRE